MSAGLSKQPTQRRQINWKRFWCPLGAGINCGDDGRGFLADPEGEYGEGTNPNVREIETLIPEAGPLILHGDPGIGKTHEFQRLKSIFQSLGGPSLVLALTFRLHISNVQEFRQRTVESDLWQAWKSGHGVLTLMIDGIDEGLIRIPTFISALHGLLEEESVERLRLILTCRSAEWPESQGNDLLGLWPRPEEKPRPIYELCPLRFKDVQLAAETLAIDAEQLGNAIWQAQAIGLATRPVTLFMLLDEFPKNGNLPSSHRELYRRGTLKLVGEVDPGRLEILRSTRGSATGATIEERFRAAQRLAALLLCCGKRAIRHREDSDNSEGEHALQITQVFETGSQPTVAAGIEALESALFTSVGQERFGFAHQTFAECLGSMQLGELLFSQVRRLLMQRDEAGEHVVPQLLELAAWTAGSHKEFRQHLLQSDPTALLHCDASVLSDEAKHQLVEAILSGAKAGHILDDYHLYRFFHTLKHPGIGAQLRPYIVDKTGGPDSRSIAIEIAERCLLSELSDDLFAVVKEETGTLKESAAEALCEVLPANRLAELVPLARGETGDDPKQSIRGHTLKRLIPVHWSVSDALPHIQAKADDRYYGSYHRFLGFELPKHLRVEDVPCILEWLRNNLGVLDSLSARKKFAQRALELALQELDRDEVAQPFTQLWTDLAAQYLTSTLADLLGLKKRLAEDVPLRRKVVSLLLNAHLPEGLDVWSLFYGLNIVASPDDFEWLLTQVRVVAPAAQKAWASLIETHVHDPQLRVPCWDKFLDCLAEVPALQRKFEWLRAWDLDEALARDRKATFLHDKHRRESFQQHKDRRNQEPRPIREDALEQARNNPTRAWYRLWHILHWGDDPQATVFLSRVDVESYEGWSLLTDGEKGLARNCAREFLLHCPEDTESWEPGSEASLCCTAAIWLLRNDLLNDRELAQAVSDRWIRLFGAFHYNDDHGAEELFSLLDQLDHKRALAAMMADIERDRPHIKRPFAIRVGKKCWDRRYDQALQQYAETLTDPKSFYETIDEWRDMSPNAAGEYALERLSQVVCAMDETYPISLMLVICAAILSQPVRAFQAVKDLLGRDPALAESVWSLVFHDIDTKDDQWWKAWREEEMADLYLHLVEVLPRTGDPDHDDGAIAPRTSAAWARDRIPGRIVAFSTREACHSLLHLIQMLPGQVRSLRWSYRQALTQCRRNEWCPPEVADVLKLVKNASARLIISEQDLQEAIGESLERYQRHLTHATLPAVVELWNQMPVEKKRKRELEPKDEKALQHSVARWLRDDLESTRGIIANCEVEPRLGSFTDIYVNSLRQGRQGTFEKMTGVIEVKGGWHPDVKSAMHTQLVDGYLRRNGLIAGIYLVGWFVCDACPEAGNHTGVKTLDEARRWFAKEVQRYDGKGELEMVSSVVLDCRWPQVSPSWLESMME